MNFTITGADKQSGEDVQMTLAAGSESEAVRLASQKGLLVATIKPAADGDSEDALELWGEDADSQDDAGGRAAPAVATTGSALDSLRYHVIQNPALYLLETAVNKHLREGWEPLGGIQVSMVNNQISYYQAMYRPQPQKAH